MSTFNLVMCLFGYVVGKDLGHIAYLMRSTRRLNREVKSLPW